MDYREVRKRDKIKRRGGDTSGRSLSQPKRVDYSRRRGIAVLIVLFAIVAGLGAVILKQNNIRFSILPPAPEEEPAQTASADKPESGTLNEITELTDGEGNPLPTIEPPNTYSLD